jgi:hypothetical protein
VDVALRVAVPVGIVRARERAGVWAVVVKLTYDLGETGRARLAVEQAPLTAANRTAEGLALHPDDFVERRPSCDVVIVGEGLERDLGPMRIRLGPLDRFAPRAALLGPLPETDPEGSCAAPQQRMAVPELPLDLVVEGAGRVLRARLPGPAPSAGVVLRGAFRTVLGVELALDTVLIDPVGARCSVVFRGTFSHPADIEQDVLLVVDATGRLDETPPRELARWPRAAAATRDDDVLDEDDIETTQDADAAESALAPEALAAARAMLAASDLSRTSKLDVPDAAPAVRPRLDTVDVDAFGPGAPFVQASLDPRVTMPVAERSPAAALLPFWVRGAADAPSPDAGKPLMVIGLRGTPLAYPSVPFGSSPSDPDAAEADDELEATGTGTLPPPADLPVGALVQDLSDDVVEIDPEDAEEDADEDDSLETVPPPASRPSYTAELVLPAAARGKTLPPPPAREPPVDVPFRLDKRDLPTFERRALAHEVSTPAQRTALGSAEPAGEAPPERRVQGLTLGEYARVRAELWAGRPRREVLKSRGLSELRWRVAERRWAEEIGALAQDPAEVCRLVTAVRAASGALQRGAAPGGE